MLRTRQGETREKYFALFRGKVRSSIRHSLRISLRAGFLSTVKIPSLPSTPSIRGGAHVSGLCHSGMTGCRLTKRHKWRLQGKNICSGQQDCFKAGLPDVQVKGLEYKRRGCDSELSCSHWQEIPATVVPQSRILNKSSLQLCLGSTLVIRQT